MNINEKQSGFELPPEIEEKAVESIDAKIVDLTHTIKELRAGGPESLLGAIVHRLKNYIGIGETGKKIKQLKNEKRELTEMRTALSTPTPKPVSLGKNQQDFDTYKTGLQKRLKELEAPYKEALLAHGLQIFGAELTSENKQVLQEVPKLKAQLKGLEILTSPSTTRVRFEEQDIEIFRRSRRESMAEAYEPDDESGESYMIGSEGDVDYDETIELPDTPIAEPKSQKEDRPVSLVLLQKSQTLQQDVQGKKPEELLGIAKDLLYQMSADTKALEKLTKDIEDRIKARYPAAVQKPKAFADAIAKSVAKAIAGSKILGQLQDRHAHNQLILKELTESLLKNYKVDDLIKYCEEELKDGASQLLDAMREASPQAEDKLRRHKIKLCEKNANALLEKCGISKDAKNAKERLSALSSAERLALKKELSAAKAELRKMSEDQKTTDFEKIGLQEAIKNLERIETVLTAVIKENANRHALNVMKGKATAVQPNPKLSLESMQNALIVGFTKFFSAPELFALVKAELMSNCPANEKEALLKFLIEWAKVNAETTSLVDGKPVANSELLKNMLQEINGFDNEKQAILEALKPTKSVEVKPAPNYKTSFTEKLNQVLTLSDTSEEYKQAVKEIASDFVQLQLDDYLALTVNDFIDDKWKGNVSPQRAKVTAQANTIGNFVSAQILQHDSAEDRAKLIKFFIDVAYECTESAYAGSTAAASSIYGGVTPVAIANMRSAQRLVTGVEKKIERLKELFTSGVAASNERKFLEAREGKPTLPDIGNLRNVIAKRSENVPKIAPNSEEYYFEAFQGVHDAVTVYLEPQAHLKQKILSSVETDLFKQLQEHKTIKPADFDARLKDLRESGKEEK